MTKQIELNWQANVIAMVIGLVITITSLPSAFAQTTFKVGDKIEVLSSKWYKAEIIEVKNGQFKIRYDGYSSAWDEWVTTDRMRRTGSNMQTNNQNNTNNQTQNQLTYKAGDPVEVLSAGRWVKAKILEVQDGGYSVYMEDTGISGVWKDAKYVRLNRNDQAAKGSTLITQENTAGEKYGTREPRTCNDTKAPTKGAITSALAAKYFICQTEGEWSNNLYLVDDVKVQVGSGIPYVAIIGQYSFHQVDVRHPVYPVRGTYTKYQCRRIYDKSEKPSCTVYNVKADGYCYKTTFGDWKCSF